MSWKSRKQGCVALSTADAEYVSLSAAVQEALWMKELIRDLGTGEMTAIEIMEDNQSAIHMASNPQFHGRTKHIELRYHFIRDIVGRGEVLLKYCPTEVMVADIFTKALPAPRYRELRNLLGVLKKD